MRAPHGWRAICASVALACIIDAAELAVRFPSNSGAGSEAVDGKAGVRGVTVSGTYNVSDTRSATLWMRSIGNGTVSLFSVTSDSWVVGIDADGAVEVYVAGTLAAKGECNVATNLWHHIAVVQTFASVTAGDFLTVAVDGASVPLNYTASASLTATEGRHTVEANPAANTELVLSDVRLYNGPLSALELQYLSSPAAHAEEPRGAGPLAFVSCYLFDDTVEDVAVPGSAGTSATYELRNEYLEDRLSDSESARNVDESGWLRVNAGGGTGGVSIDACADECGATGFPYFGMARTDKDTVSDVNVTVCYCRGSRPLRADPYPEWRCGGKTVAPNSAGLNPSPLGTDTHIAFYEASSRHESAAKLVLCGSHGSTDPFVDASVSAFPTSSALFAGGEIDASWGGGLTTSATEVQHKFGASETRTACVFPGSGTGGGVTGSTIIVKNAFVPGTLAFWVRLDAASPGSVSLLTWKGVFSLSLSSYSLVVAFVDTGNSLNTKQVLSTAVWYHIKVEKRKSTHDGGFAVYLNGMRIGVFPVGYVSMVTSSTLYIGTDGVTTGPLFMGQLFDVRFYREGHAVVPEDASGGLVRRYCSDGSLFRGLPSYAVQGSPEGGATVTADRAQGSANFCDMRQGGSVVLEGSTALNFPLTVMANVRFPKGCATDAAVNTTAFLGALFGWRDTEESSTYNHPHIALFSSGRSEVYAGGWDVQYPASSAQTRWADGGCDNVWRHVSVSIYADKTVRVYFDGVLAYTGAFHSGYEHRTGYDGVPYSPVETRIGGRYYGGVWHGNIIHIHEFRLYRGVTLSEHEVVKALYSSRLQAQRGGSGTVRDDLLCHHCASTSPRKRSVGADQSALLRDAEVVGGGVSFEAGQGGCSFDGGSDACLLLPTYRSRPKEFTISAWVKVAAGSKKCAKVQKIYSGLDSSTSQEYQNLRHGYFTNIDEDLADGGVVFGWFGTEVASALQVRRTVEAALVITKNYYVAWREVDDTGVARIATPAERLSHNLCLGETANQWTHVALSIDDSNAPTLFINGNSVALTVTQAGLGVGGAVAPDTSRQIFDETAIGCSLRGYHAGGNARLQRVSASLKGSLKDVKVVARALSAAELVKEAAHGGTGEVLKACHGSLGDASGFGRDLQQSSDTAAFLQLDRTFFGQKVCSVQGDGRLHLPSTNLIDRPFGLTVSMWVRRKKPGRCALRDDSALFSLVNTDRSYLEYNALGQQGVLTEATGEARSVETIGFSACGTLASCSNTTGWSSPAYRANTCMRWMPPCGDVAASSGNTYVYFSSASGVGSASAAAFSITASFFTENTCNTTATRSAVVGCGQCMADVGANLTALDGRPCAAYLLAHSVEMTYAKRSTAEPADSACDLSWHHHAVVIPPHRTDAVVYYDFLPRRHVSSNGSSTPAHPLPPAKDFSFGQLYNSANDSFYGNPHLDFADVKVFPSALRRGDILAGARAVLRWRRLRGGVCRAGYIEVDGASLSQCQGLCLATPNCRVLQFPLAGRPDGCRVQAHDADAAACGAEAGAEAASGDVSLFFPHPQVGEGGVVAKLCHGGVVGGEAVVSDHGNYTALLSTSEEADGRTVCAFAGASFAAIPTLPERSSIDVLHRPHSFTVAFALRVDKMCRPPGDARYSYILEWSDDNAQRQGIGLSPLGHLFYSSGTGTTPADMTYTKSAFPLCSRRGLGVWRNVAVTLCDKGVLSLYIDGVLTSTSVAAHPWSPGGAALSLGKSTHAVSSEFKGRVHSLKVYNKHYYGGDAEASGAPPTQTLRSMLPAFSTDILKVCGGWGLFERVRSEDKPGGGFRLPPYNYSVFEDGSGAGRHPSVVHRMWDGFSRPDGGAKELYSAQELADTAVGGACVFGADANGTAGGEGAGPVSFLEWYAGHGAPLRSDAVELSMYVRPWNCSGVQMLASWGGAATRGAALYLNERALTYTEAYDHAEPRHVAASPESQDVLCGGSGWHHVALHISGAGRVTLSVDGNDTTSGDSVEDFYTRQDPALFSRSVGRGDADSGVAPNEVFGSSPWLVGNNPLNGEFALGKGGLFGLESGQECPHNATQCGGKCFFVVQNASEWRAAGDACATRSLVAAGYYASLAAVHADEELTVAAATLRASGVAAAYIGFSYDASSEHYTYSSSMLRTAAYQREVDYFPATFAGAPSTATGTLCGTLTAAGAFALDYCNATLPVLCEVSRVYSFAGSMSGVLLRHTEGHARSHLDSAQADIMQNVDLLNAAAGVSAAGATATATVQAYAAGRCSVDAIKGSRPTYAGDNEGEVHANVVEILDDGDEELVTLWLSGLELKGCVARLGSVEVATEFAGLRGEEPAHLSALTLDAQHLGRLPRDVPVTLFVSPFPAGSPFFTPLSLSATNFSVVVTERLRPSSVRTAADGTEVRFQHTQGLRRHDDALLGIAPAAEADCTGLVASVPLRRSTTGGAPRRRRNALALGTVLPPVQGRGGEYQLCLKLSGSAAFVRILARNATVHIAGRCGGHGVYLVGKGRCSCFLDAHHGYWDGDACDLCANGFFGKGCQSECSPQHCSQRGVCTSEGDCNCDLGYVGARCETELSCSAVHKAVLTPQLSLRALDDSTRLMLSSKQLVRYPLSSSLSDEDGTNPFVRVGNVSIEAAGHTHIDSTDWVGTPSFIHTVPGAANMTFGAVALWFRNLLPSNVTDMPFMCVGSGSFQSVGSRFYSTNDLCVYVNSADSTFHTSFFGDDAGGSSKVTALAREKWHSLVVSLGRSGHGDVAVFLDGSQEVTLRNPVNHTVFRGDAGTTVYIGGHDTDVKHVLISPFVWGLSDAASMHAVGLVDRESLPCPGVCNAEVLLGQFTFEDSLKELSTAVDGSANNMTFFYDTTRTVKGRLVDNDGAADIASLTDAATSVPFLALNGRGFFNTKVAIPQDEWGVSLWVRLDTPFQQAGCLYASVYEPLATDSLHPKTKPLSDDDVTVLSSRGMLEQVGGMKVLHDLCIVNTTSASMQVVGTVFSDTVPKEASYTQASLGDGAWHHVVHTSSYEGQAVYVDGEVVARSRPARVAVPHTRVFVGYGHLSTYPYFVGHVADVKVFSQALSSRDVAGLHKGKPGGHVGPSGGLHAKDAPTYVSVDGRGGATRMPIRKYPF